MNLGAAELEGMADTEPFHLLPAYVQNRLVAVDVPDMDLVHEVGVLCEDIDHVIAWTRGNIVNQDLSNLPVIYPPDKFRQVLLKGDKPPVDLMACPGLQEIFIDEAFRSAVMIKELKGMS